MNFAQAKGAGNCRLETRIIRVGGRTDDQLNSLSSLLARGNLILQIDDRDSIPVANAPAGEQGS